MSFTIARSIEDALAALAAGARPIAGGSDLVVSARHGSNPLPEKLVAVDRIRELRNIESVAGDSESGCAIGAGVTHARLMDDPLIVADYTALADAAALVGSPATRNVGTLGGNVMNGSPAMDTGAPLVVLGATIELRSFHASRELNVSELWSGPGETTAEANELCTAVRLPSRPERSGSAYVRLEYRRAMEIAVVGAAASVELDDDGLVANAAIALTAVAPTIVSVHGIDLAGHMPDEDACAVVGEAAAEQANPITDLRASDRYRRAMVAVMAKRAFDAAARRAGGEHIAVPVNRALGIGASA